MARGAVVPLPRSVGSSTGAVLRPPTPNCLCSSSSPRSCFAASLPPVRLVVVVVLARLSPSGTHVLAIGLSVALRRLGGEGRNDGTVVTVAALSPYLFLTWGCLAAALALPKQVLATAVAVLFGKLVSLPGYGGQIPPQSPPLGTLAAGDLSSAPRPSPLGPASPDPLSIEHSRCSFPFPQLHPT